MIISHEREYVQVGIPRTGSRSMAAWLTEHFDGFRVGGNHSLFIPEDARCYPRFTVIRNPADRIVSMSKVSEEDPEVFSQEVLNWSKWFVGAKEPGMKLQPGLNCVHQAQWIDEAGINHIYKFEDLPGCLNRLWFVTGNIDKFPHSGRSVSVRHPLNDEAMGFIRNAFASDFALWESL